MSQIYHLFMASESRLQKGRWLWPKGSHGIAGEVLAGAGVSAAGSAEEGSLARLTSAVACFLELLLRMSHGVELAFP